MLVQEYVPLVRAAIADIEDIYIPGGNRELFEAAAIFYGISHKCGIFLKKDFLNKNNEINIMISKGSYEEFANKIPALDEKFKKKFAHYALESAMMDARNYPSQMHDLILHLSVCGFIGTHTAIMVMDILYNNGTLKPLNEREKITSNLIMFSDVLPKN